MRVFGEETLLNYIEIFYLCWYKWDWALRSYSLSLFLVTLKYYFFDVLVDEDACCESFSLKNSVTKVENFAQSLHDLFVLVKGFVLQRASSMVAEMGL